MGEILLSLPTFFERARRFESEAHSILGVSEVSASRLVLLRASYDRLTGLSLKQDDMLRQSLRCVEVGVFRAAHVLAFAAFIDYLHEHAASDGFAALKAARPNWKIASIDDIRDNVTDYAFVEGMCACGLITKTEKKAAHGLLTRRNECAHPSDYYPDLNETLGYISEILNRLEFHKKRVAVA